MTHPYVIASAVTHTQLGWIWIFFILFKYFSVLLLKHCYYLHGRDPTQLHTTHLVRNCKRSNTCATCAAPTSYTTPIRAQPHMTHPCRITKIITHTQLVHVWLKKTLLLFAHAPPRATPYDAPHVRKHNNACTNGAGPTSRKTVIRVQLRMTDPMRNCKRRNPHATGAGMLFFLFLPEKLSY